MYGLKSRTSNQPVLPIFRLPMQVHDRDDPDAVFLLRVKDAIGKTMHQGAPYLSLQDLPSMGKSKNTLNRGSDLG